jgi:hypothetical protein
MARSHCLFEWIEDGDNLVLSAAFLCMKRLVIELENDLRHSLTPSSGERLEVAIRKHAKYLRGHRPQRVLIQEYDARLSTKFRYMPAPQLLEVLLRELGSS